MTDYLHSHGLMTAESAVSPNLNDMNPLKMTHSSVGRNDDTESKREKAYRRSSEGMMPRKSHMLPPTYPGRTSHRMQADMHIPEQALALYNPMASKLERTNRGTS